jgi:hypothetical protein
MPVIIEREDWPIWLGESDPNTVLRPAPEDILPAGRRFYALQANPSSRCWRETAAATPAARPPYGGSCEGLQIPQHLDGPLPKTISLALEPREC